MSTVLVTGGTGFVASHLILQLLSANYTVRTTLRSLAGPKKASLLDMLRSGGANKEHLNNLSFYQADLTTDDGWADAIAGCDFVHHVASPFPGHEPKNEDDIIIPAREGTLRVLREAQRQGVKRVIFTSSFGAVGYGYKPAEKDTFDEEDWSREEGLSAYLKSKLYAERAAWDFVKEHGNTLELSVVNPVGIFGPILSKDGVSSSIGLVKSLLDGSVPACPRMFFNMVDVRDVASLHILCMTQASAAGQRFLASSTEPVSMLQLAQSIGKLRPDFAGKVPTKEIPDWAVRAMSCFSSKMKAVLPQVGIVRRVKGQKASEMLGWKRRDEDEMVGDMVDALVRLELVK
jgi:dihydroflavonol-4-reductase